MHEIFHQSIDSTSLTFTGGQLKIRETDSSSGYGIRVLHKDKIGFSYCQHKDEINSAIEQAKKLSHFSIESSFSFAPNAHFKKLEISNPIFSPENYKKIYEIVEEAREAAESHGGKSKIIAELVSSRTELENTEGFSGAYDKTDFSFYVECMDADGFGISYYVSNLKFPDARAVGMRAAEMAKNMQGAKKPSSGNYTVVMEIEALSSLIDIFLPSFSGDWKHRNITKLTQNEKMFDNQLTICDDPFSKGSEGRPFDDEGVISHKKYLVKNGQIKSFFYDRETAALEGVDENGACSRASYASPPTIGGTNITISPGDWKNLDDLGKYLEIHHAHGSHTANPTTGDFGLEVSSAFMIDKGKKTPLKGFMLTGNIFDLFANIEAIESTTKILDYLEAPRIAFRNIHIVS
ncbi:TldD/PmbA family protein [Candidatus Micrarchaeota archaeon]|nr:TldD/PmbA family protein [Candidatus Micrarchaeota archaeon]